MNMTRLQWKGLRVLMVVGVAILLYLLVRIKIYEHKASVFLSKIHPNDVWEYVADFSNMKYLNPTIVDFNILDEKGNYEHWKYTTEYKEYLSHWPYLPNYSTAFYSIKSSPKKDKYYVNSVHITCLLNSVLCLNSESEFTFSHANMSKGGALCEEIVTYQCPTFLSLICKREVTYQREAIMGNLRRHFLERPTKAGRKI